MPTIFEKGPCPTLEQSCLHVLQPVWSETLRNLKFCIFEQKLPLSVAKIANDVPLKLEVPSVRLITALCSARRFVCGGPAVWVEALVSLLSPVTPSGIQRSEHFAGAAIHLPDSIESR